MILNFAPTAYENLANSIILQAVEDYRKARYDLARNVGGNDFQTRAQAEMSQCIKFFRSQWFVVLSNINPELIIHGLEMENAMENRKKKDFCGVG